MWKKDEVSSEKPEEPREERGRPERSAAGPGSGGTAAIGPSISIKGEVTGDEDLLIEGRLDGSVDLKQHSVTVGPEGEVSADIVARVVTVAGRVDGNINAGEQAVLRRTAVVHGDIKAPRVVLEDGARFRGGVDMGEASRSERGAGAVSRPQAGKGSSLQKTDDGTSGAKASKDENQKTESPTGAEA